jgi:endoglucanase
MVLLSSEDAHATQIVEVRAGAPGVIAVVLETGFLEEGDRAYVSVEESEWSVDGRPPVSIDRYAIPYDELAAAQGWVHRVSVRHRVYLSLGAPFDPGHRYRVSTPYGSRAFAFDEDQVLCEAIKVNQVGYNRRSTSRFANFGVYLGSGGSRTYDPPPSYRVVRESDGAVLVRGSGRYMGDDTRVVPKEVTSGEHVYRLSLNDVPEGGPYHVVVGGCGRSRSFGVGDRYTREIAYVAARGLYHQRCGIALERPHTNHTRGACHLEVADTRTPWSAGTFIDVPDSTPTFSISGGHHDAADFDRRPMHLIIPILMFAYVEAFPENFRDGHLDIPESGNGIPDFLDEALWALRVWEQLQVSDPDDPEVGGVRQGTEAAKHPTYGRHSAANDDMRYGTFAVGVESTALAAGAFAQASRLIAPYDMERSVELLERARSAWSWLLRSTDVGARETKFMYAALQLFRDIAPFMLRPNRWPEVYRPGNIYAKCQTAHFISYLLTDRAVDEELASLLRARVFSSAEKGTYMGPAPEEFPYPQGVTKGMGWGAATAQGRYANVYVFAYRLSADPSARQRYFNAAAQYGDFSLGLNPLGISFVTGLGTDQPRSPLHLDSYFTKYGETDGVTTDHVGKPKGNVPGILVFGPRQRPSKKSHERAVSDKLFPGWWELPALRRWGDGWSLVTGNEFSVHATIVWNAVLHGFLYDPRQEPPTGKAGVEDVPRS